MSRNDLKQQIWQKDKQHFIHPWSEFESFKQHGSLVMESGKGSFVYDIDGNAYLDGIAGLWCVNIGYGRTELAEVAKQQMEKLCYYSMFGHHATEPGAFLSARLAELAPTHINHVHYALSGSAANDSAVRIVHHYFNRLGKPQKKHVISRKDAYHGSTYLAMSMTGIKQDHIDFTIEDKWVHHISAPNMYRRPAGAENLDEAEYCDFLVDEFKQKILEIGEDKVAMFIAEPIMGAGGVIVAPNGYHKKMWDICQKYNIKYVSDEIVTAFGRLGHMFASEAVFGIKPDIINIAKGLTSGYIPLAATMVSDEIYDVISQPRGGLVFTHGFTYSGHPVSCAVALENIRIMEDENICDHIKQVGPYLENRLKSLNGLDLIGDVRGSNFMICLESVQNKNTKQLFPLEVNVGGRVSKYAQQDGVLVRPIGHKNVISPPLTFSTQQIDKLVDTVHNSILRVQDDLTKEGLW